MAILAAAVAILGLISATAFDLHASESTYSSFRRFNYAPLNRRLLMVS